MSNYLKNYFTIKFENIRYRDKFVTLLNKMKIM